MFRYIDGVAYEMTPGEVAEWEATQAANPPTPPSRYTLPVSALWLRMTEAEAELLDAALLTALPVRLRKAFGKADSMDSDGELFAFVNDLLTPLVTAPRTTELLAIPSPGWTPMADLMAEDEGPGLVGG